MDTRSTNECSPVAPTIIRTSQDLRLPRWVNEPLPDLRALLSASEISRLTRRPRWLLLGLAILGRFPKQRTHCGKPVGWHRADVLDWLTQNMAVEAASTLHSQDCRHARPSQACLPLELSQSRRTPNERHRRRHSTGGSRP